ncbi:MAG TPA: SpoIIE family protein phosphatase [Thermoanaerobaculia bacterium]|nr:SpoIIE family protein phosphatase [Thermoanaerobaculia bacterium]
MLPAQKFSELLGELDRLDRLPHSNSALQNRGHNILGALLRHAGYSSGAIWLQGPVSRSLLLAARTPDFECPSELSRTLPLRILDRSGNGESEEWSRDYETMQPAPHTLVPLRRNETPLGLVALRRDQDEIDGGTLELLEAAASYLSMLLTAQRMADEAREGDFQLKYRLWELESLYDIGLSIASTLDQQELSDEILIRTISLLNARRAALYLRKGEQYEMFRSFGEVRGQFFGSEIDPDSFSGLLKNQSPIRLSEGADCLFPGCETLIAVPVATATEMVGVLAVADKELRDGGVGGFDEKDVRLLQQFATQAAMALENARLHKDALEKQAIERELELAATIQRDILPRTIPTFPGMEIEVLARPARQLGGDYYTFIEREEGMSLCVADVSGKSVPAAILVSALHAALQLLFDEGRELGEIATELNRHIHHWSSETKFITLILATIDRENGLIRYVNAGHNPGYLVPPGGSLEILHSHGLPIGLMSDSRYSVQTRPLPAGSLITFYSDGITEADDETGDEFGSERLEALLLREHAAPVKSIRSSIDAAVQEFVGGAPQRDDQTLVLVRV